MAREDEEREEREQREKDRGFKVEDKRRFDSAGSARGEGAAGDDAAADPVPDPDALGPGPTPGDASPPEAEAADLHAHDEGPGAELTFTSFVVGLASHAFMFLGLAPDPQSGVVHKDVGQAKAMIDIVVMLAEKTAGNLNDDEAHMMDELLYELRMAYVREIRGETETEEGLE